MLCSACISPPPPVFALIIITLIPPFPTDRDRPSATAPPRCSLRLANEQRTAEAGLEKDRYSTSLEIVIDYGKQIPFFSNNVYIWQTYSIPTYSVMTCMCTL